MVCVFCPARMAGKNFFLKSSIVDQAGGQPFMDREDIVILSADIVILSEAKNLRLTFGKILRCAQR